MSNHSIERPDPKTEPEKWQAYWKQQIEEAQTLTKWFIGNKAFDRIRYGDEEGYPSDLGICHDCGIVTGQYHVPSCNVEQCPKCHGQAISCPCRYAEGQEVSEERDIVEKYMLSLTATLQTGG